MYPKEFRIAPPIWPPDLLSALDKLAQHPLPEPSVAPPKQTEEPQTDKEQLRMLADVGTGLWRLRQKMVRPGTDQPLEEMHRAYRHLMATWDALTLAGVEIHDHTDTPYDPGMSLEVIAFEPTTGIPREKVIETIKPTIYFKARPIQIGQVIVGTPQMSGGDLAQSDTDETNETRNSTQLQ